MDDSLGNHAKPNMFEHVDINVKSILRPERKSELTFLLPIFIMDKAIVIDGSSGRILANRWTVTDVSRGITSGGVKLQAASAIAQKNTFALKCSEDACFHDGTIGEFNIFPGVKHPINAPAMQSAADLQLDNLRRDVEMLRSSTCSS